MSYQVYKIIHLVGLALMFAALGGVLFAPRNDQGRPPRAVAVLHGVGALLMLVAGFGLLARMSIHWPWPNWVLVKVVIWVALGVAPLVLRRMPRLAGLGSALMAVLLTALAGFAVAMVQYKPW